jgi:hypothetical protein
MFHSNMLSMEKGSTFSTGDHGLHHVAGIFGVTADVFHVSHKTDQMKSPPGEAV